MSEREDQIIAPLPNGKLMVCSSGKPHGFFTVPFHPLARSFACVFDGFDSGILPTQDAVEKCRLMAAERCLVCGAELKDAELPSRKGR